MVRIRRPPAPRELVEKQAAGTGRWKHNREDGRGEDWCPGSLRASLREAVHRLTHGKCAFCERIIEIRYELEIEHYLPKSKYADLVLEWSNLFPACRYCNEAKGEVDHGGALLKADSEDPEMFFRMNPANGDLEPHPRLTRDEARRAVRSIEICRLNRGSLREARLMVYRLFHYGLKGDSLTAIKSHLEELSRPGHPHKLVLRQSDGSGGSRGIGRGRPPGV